MFILVDVLVVQIIDLAKLQSDNKGVVVALMAGAFLNAAAGLGDEPLSLDDPFDGKANVDRVETQRNTIATQPDPSYESKVHQRIAGELARSTSLSFIDKPLSEVLQEISRSHQIPVVLDVHALNGRNIDPNTLVTISVRNVNLRAALKWMLSKLELAHVMKDEALQVTTKAVAVQSPYDVVYLVGPHEHDASNRDFVDRLQASLNQKRVDSELPHELVLLRPSNVNERRDRLLVRANQSVHYDVHKAVRNRHEAGMPDVERIQGDWEVVRGETSGIAIERNGTAGIRITFAGNRVNMITADGRESVFEFTLDPTTSPKSIDLTPKVAAEQQGHGRARRGVYGVKGDDAVLCFGNNALVERPRAFAAPKGSHSSFVLLKRVGR